jgi:endonuclease G
VVTGPVFVAEGDMMRFQLIGRRLVAVPTHFFKIVHTRGGEEGPSVIAFLLPNAPASPKDLAEHITSVDLIEEQTGLDFFSGLEDGLEESLESRKAAGLDSW